MLACLAMGCGLGAMTACGSDGSGDLGTLDGGAGADGGSLPEASTADGNGNGNGDGDASSDASRDGGNDAANDGGNDAASDGGHGANPVQGENALPGTVDWGLVNPATQREIEGYPSVTSVAPGGKISLFVSTASAQYTIDVYRLGWYGGAGGRQQQPQVQRNGTLQTTPVPDADGLVECNWTDPYELTVPMGWVSGIYVAKLTTKNTGKQSYVPFVVRDDVRVATYLVQSSVTTFQAYNNWGGPSLYDFNSVGGVRASRVSLHRPYALGLNPQSAAGVGAGELITNLQGAAQTGPTGWEYPALRFLEREGYDVSYVTNVDVHRDAQLVAAHPVFLSVGHDEYWSARMRDHVEQARDHGATSLAFFSGNVGYWQIRMDPAKSGDADTTITCFKDAATDPFASTPDLHLTTVRWDDPLIARSEQGLGGLSLQDFGINADLVVLEPKSWVFGSTGLTLGAHLPSLLGYEVDGASEPPISGVRRVMRSPWTSSQPSSGASEAAVRALPSGAETFAAGSIQFAWGLDDHRSPGVVQPLVGSAAAQQIARNVLDRFALPRPARIRSPILLDETFATPLDPDRWSLRTVNEGAAAFDPAVTVVATGGHLVITPRTGVSGLHHNGATTARTYALTCGSARVELVQAASAASGADTTFAMVADAGRWYRITVESGALVFGTTDGAPAQTTVAYDAVQHRHLRIRHDCVADKVLYETSPDAVTWTTRRTIPATVDLRSAYVELEAGTYQSEAAPGQAIFDNLHLEVTGVRETFTSQRDPDVFTPTSLHEGGYDPEVDVFTGGGHLHLRSRAGLAGLHHLGFATTREIDWTGGVVSATIVQGPNPATEASLSLAVLAQTPGWARTTVSAGNLYFQSENTGVTSGTFITFDPVAHKVVRIRHDAGPDQIVWETSPDGATWTEQRRVARPFALAAARAEIEGGTYRVETDSGEAIVDDFVFAK
jgi:hypothetical protein